MNAKLQQSAPAIWRRAVELLEGLTAISSQTGDATGLEQAVQLLASELEDRGLTCHLDHDHDAGGSAMPFMLADGPRAAQTPLLLVGHLDTVLPANSPQRDGHLLRATGAVDMKGGLVVLVAALDLLAETGRRWPADLRLLVVPDEEIAGPICRRLVRQHGRSARQVWVLEPGRPIDAAGTAETLVIGRRGLAHWRLEVDGRSAHAGNGYWQGRSALLAAADFCQQARALAAPEAGPTVNIGRLVAGERDFVDHLAEQAALVGSNRQTNVVPDRAVADGEARYLTVAGGNAIERQMHAIAGSVAGTHEVTARLVFSGHVVPLEAEGASTLAERAQRLAEARGWRLELETDRPGISFPNMLAEPSRVPVLDGLGPVGGGMHTRDEFVDLRSFERRIELLADLLAADADAR